MAIFDFLFGSKNPPPVTTTEGMSIPSYIAEPSADIIGEAMDVAKEGYQAYQDPRLAGLTQTEKDAMQQGVGMAGIGALQRRSSIYSGNCGRCASTFQCRLLHD